MIAYVLSTGVKAALFVAYLALTAGATWFTHKALDPTEYVEFKQRGES